MFELTSSSGMSRRVIQIGAFAILTVGIVMAIRDDAFGPFLSVLLLGSAVGGASMIALSRHRAPHHELNVPDSFQRDGLGSQVIDASRIRVAGIGGLGMMAMAVALGVFIPRIGVSLALGLVGGFFVSLALAAYRRRHAGQWQ